MIIAKDTEDVAKSVPNTYMCSISDSGEELDINLYAYGPHEIFTCDSSVLSPGTKVCNRAYHWVNDMI